MCCVCACVVGVHVLCVCLCCGCACVVFVHVLCVCLCCVCACVVCVHVLCVCLCCGCACVVFVHVLCVCLCCVCACVVCVPVLWGSCVVWVLCLKMPLHNSRLCLYTLAEVGAALGGERGRMGSSQQSLEGLRPVCLCDMGCTLVFERVSPFISFHDR